MANWDEVKRLAADFQKIQLSSTTQRLSERNCVEIVSWLVNRKIIDLIYTSDGKEYLTPAQLIQDIKGELYVSGGRVNFVELAKTIGVDLNHITSHINEAIRDQKDVYAVLGQLIDGTYIAKIASEINEKLQQQGQISVSDLTIQYDLPADFIQQNILEKHLGKIIHGQQDKSDPKIFFTESFIARSKAKIKGALIGLTRPTPVSVILNLIDVSDKLFFSLFDQTPVYGFLTSRVAGAAYIPNIYSRSQNEWINSFYKQNGYLEFDALIRIGITDYKTYLKKQFINEKLVTLKSCVVSMSIVERLEADIEECISSKTYVDLQTNLPSVFSPDDVELLLNKILTPQKLKQVVVMDNFIISKAFLDSLSKDCETVMHEKAKQAVDSGRYQLFQTSIQVASKATKGEPEADNIKVDKREERRKKAAGGKSGGGTQGRETKTKSVKKPHRTIRSNDDDDDDDVQTTEKKMTFEVITIKDVQDLIQHKLEEEGLEELLENIATYLLTPINEKGLEIVAELYASTVLDRTANRRQTHSDIQNKVNSLLSDIRLFDKGIKPFPAEIQHNLTKYLLKTVCTDVVNEILNYVSGEEGLNTVTDSFTNEQRLKFINSLPAEYKTALQSLTKSLLGQNIEEFMVAVEEALVTCSMIIKKIDKKKDRLIILNHKHSLLDQLEKCDDPALVLHLCSLIIFTTATQNMLHASGRHVASILTFLKQYLTQVQLTELAEYHELVTIMLSGNSEEAENARDKLKEKMPVIKLIANEYKKSTEKS